MANFSINGAVSTLTGWISFQQLSCQFSISSSLGNVNPSGVRYIQVDSISLSLSGKDGSRTVALGIWNSSLSLVAKTANFTVASSTSAPQTGYKALLTPYNINTSTIGSSLRVGFWVSGSQSVYYQRDSTGQTVDTMVDTTTKSAISNFTDTRVQNADSSLVGNINYNTLPTAPLNLTAVAGQGQVSLSWSAPSSNGGKTVTSYTLQRATNSTFTTGLTTTTHTETSATITGLTNGTQYFFRVAAVNSVATSIGTTSANSSTASATPTTSASPPGAPTGLSGTPNPFSGFALDLSWTAPASDGGSPITGYRISYSYEVFIGFAFTVLTGSTSTSFTLDGLDLNTPYIITVAAINAAGTSEESNEVRLLTQFISNTEGIIKRYDSSIPGWRVLV
jgi:hypothetical protein